MTDTRSFPLDLAQTPYSYIERPNAMIQALLRKHVLGGSPSARVLDVGCGCGANARAVREKSPSAYVLGIEPNARASELAREHCSEVFVGLLDDWLKVASEESFDAVVLADVLEHIGDPVPFLRSLARAPATRKALWIVSVPNYAVWYNRVRTMLGRFDYAWSGLYDRTHVRFYTRASIRKLLDYCGIEVIDDRCTPSLVQSAAPLLRQFFKDDVAQGNHLALTGATPYRVYEKFVEPAETLACALWPELLGFQIVSLARVAGG